jgi:hypothetical protein
VSNQDPIELIRLAVNKTIVSERKGRGRRGYGRLAAVRLLVYAMLMGTTKIRRLRGTSRKTLGLRGSWGSNEAFLIERR